MTTNAVARDDRMPDSLRREGYEMRAAPVQRRIGRVGLGTAGVTAVLVSAWGGIVPYVGPLFGYSGDGSGSWHWNLAHAILGLAPGAVGVLLGLFVIAEARGTTFGKGRMSLATAGTLLMVCGAWFAIGPLAWPVLDNSSSYSRRRASYDFWRMRWATASGRVWSS